MKGLSFTFSSLPLLSADSISLLKEPISALLIRLRRGLPGLSDWTMCGVLPPLYADWRVRIGLVLEVSQCSCKSLVYVLKFNSLIDFSEIKAL